MPFITSNLCLMVEGPENRNPKTGFSPLVTLSRGHQFGFRPLEESKTDAKIHYRGTYEPAPNRCWTCAKPLVKIWIEDFVAPEGLPDMAKWKWFLDYFFNQYGEAVIFFEESAQDVFCTDKNYKEDRKKWELPIPVLDLLVQKNLINDEIIIEQYKMRKRKEETEGVEHKEIEVHNISTAPIKAPETEVSKEKIMELLSQQDPNLEFKVNR